MLKELSFLLILATSTVFALHLPRPWENRSWVAENPNIWSYGADFWWNIPEFDHTLYSFQPVPLSKLGINGSTSDYLGKYEFYLRKAESDRQNCFLDILGGIGIFPTDPSAVFIRAFGSSSSCMSYGDDWRMAVDSSLVAAESSVSEGERSIAMARDAYARLVFLGICGGDFAGAGSQVCPEIESAFLSIDQNVAEGDFGKHARIRAASDTFLDGLSEPVPDLSPSADIIGLTWGRGGLIDNMDELRSDAERAESETKAEYGNLKTITERRKELAGARLSTLMEAGASRITRAAESSYLVEPGSISQRFEALINLKRSLDSGLEDAILEHGRTWENGSLSGSVSMMAETEKGYSMLLDHISTLESDLQSAVDAQKSEAEDELAASERAGSLPSPESASVLETARKAFEEAKASGNPGDSFVLFSKAAALARSARSIREYHGERDIQSSLSILSETIARAEKDGIDVASEKASLVLLRQLRSYDTSYEINQSIGSILSKARLKYEDDLLSRRKSIMDKLSFSGPGAADLYTDLANSEQGMVLNGSLSFREALGSLAKLRAKYIKIESEVDSYTRDRVGNAISVSASPLVTDVHLDEPAEISLDAVLSNPRPYNATDVVARISMPGPIDFLYSDITSGRDWIESLRMQDGGKTIMLSIPRVGSFETRRVIFIRRSVLAHTIKRESIAEGIGDGRAYLSERVKFSLDIPIKGFLPPAGFEEATIDGSSDIRVLEAGEHLLASGRIVEDAYSEKTTGIKSYKVGTNSHVEYGVVIEPHIDLDSVNIVIDLLNDSSMHSIEITSGTGETVGDKRRLSGTKMSVLAKGLKKGKNMTLLVSYDIEDTESFVNEHLADLRSSNMSEKAKELLDEAETQAKSGNYSRALELMEKTVAQSEEDRKTKEKLRSKCDSAASSVSSELEGLKLAVPENRTSPFERKLGARLSELERLLNESNCSDAASLGALDGYDRSWLDKQLTQLKKDTYKSYNSLKERLFRAGDSSTPDEFVALEESLSDLESGNRIEYAISLVHRLDNASAFVSSRENSSNSTKAFMQSSLEALRVSVTDVMEAYSKQAAEAKGTDYSSAFIESERTATRLLSEAKDSLANDPRIFWQKISELNKSRQKMAAVLDNLEKEAENRVSVQESFIRGANFDEQKRSSLSEKIAAIKKMISSGSYIAALRSSASLDKELNEKSPQDNSFVLLGITGLAILGAVAFYAVRREPKKKLKKLASLESPTGPLPEPSDSRSRK